MLGGSSGGPGGDALPLEPYPGMTLTGRTADRRRSPIIQPDSGEETTTSGRLDLREAFDSVDETQGEEQNATAGERDLLILHESRLQSGTTESFCRDELRPKISI